MDSPGINGDCVVCRLGQSARTGVASGVRSKPTVCAHIAPTNVVHNPVVQHQLDETFGRACGAGTEQEAVEGVRGRRQDGRDGGREQHRSVR